MGAEADEKPKVDLRPKSQSQQPKAKTKRDGLFVHPKGNVAKQIKVSCASCISGHRSGECNHFDRILLQIRAAGRPSNTCHHNVSCGGSCLEQKAFVIPGDEPKWCRNHRSCIENWEYSDYCPPYPVSSKRKGRSYSPSRTSQTSATPTVAPKGNGEKTAVPQIAAGSCCSSEANRSGDAQGPSGPLVAPTHPIMVTASYHGHVPPSIWTPKSINGSEPFATPFEPLTPALTTSTNSGVFVTTPDLASLQPHAPTAHFPYFDPYDMGFSTATVKPNATLYNTSTNTYIDDSSSYQDDLATAHRHEFNSLPSYSNSFPTAALAAPAMAPLSLPAQPQSRSQEPQQCPGNGFQCPCDENCMCADCYTHVRGFWTLPVDLGNVQSALADFEAPPSQISHSTPEPAPSRRQSPRYEVFIDDGHETDGPGAAAATRRDDDYEDDDDRFDDTRRLSGFGVKVPRYY